MHKLSGNNIPMHTIPHIPLTSGGGVPQGIPQPLDKIQGGKKSSILNHPPTNILRSLVRLGPSSKTSGGELFSTKYVSPSYNKSTPNTPSKITHP